MSFFSIMDHISDLMDYSLLYFLFWQLDLLKIWVSFLEDCQRTYIWWVASLCDGFQDKQFIVPAASVSMCSCGPSLFDSVGHVFLVSSIHSYSYSFFLPLFHSVSSALRRRIFIIPLHNIGLCVSVPTPIYCWWKPFWWWLHGSTLGSLHICNCWQSFSVQPGLIAIPYQRNTQTFTLIINWLAY